MRWAEVAIALLVLAAIVAGVRLPFAETDAIGAGDRGKKHRGAAL